MSISWDLIELVVGLCLAAAAALSAGTGMAILLFRVPAKATLIEDGHRRAVRERNAAVILTERSPLPHFVTDFVSFVTDDGREIRATLRRSTLLLADPPALVWYSPGDPRRVTGIRPLSCFAWALGSMVTLAWLWW